MITELLGGAVITLIGIKVYISKFYIHLLLIKGDQVILYFFINWGPDEIERKNKGDQVKPYEIF